MTLLQVGQSETCTIPSRPRDVRTGVTLEATRRYVLTASGRWTDLHNECGPEGYPSPNLLLRAAERFRRVPHANWFALIGVIGDGDPFVIGTVKDISPDRSGELVCYANDVSLFYANNSGSVTLVVRRTA